MKKGVPILHPCNQGIGKHPANIDKKEHPVLTECLFASGVCSKILPIFDRTKVKITLLHYNFKYLLT